eukprot:TRINITY_DN1047_c0_g6_i1.p1 TRINITY_DN1047_c0_g6~~TRINITY_DN1047_c0_g6_i1.p1  ORF type:complete len:359 (+),score=130.78 TRINITY_DN1047_c0_g6_i1:78-1079(+)
MAPAAEFKVVRVNRPVAYRKSATLIAAAPCCPDQAGGYDYKLCLLRRGGKGTFKHGVVFPGGASEAVDAEVCAAACPGQAPDAPASPNPLDTLRMRVCAVREAFEEAGAQVFTKPLGDAAGAWRAAMQDRAGAYKDLVEKAGTAPAVDRLHFWCSFITPEVEASRMKKGGFETAFFATVLEHHQIGGDGAAAGMSCCAQETTELLWLTPREALRAHAAGTIRLFPPQWAVLRQLEPVARRADIAAAAASPARALFRDHVIKPYVLVPAGGPEAKDAGVWAAYPGDALHPDYPHPGGVNRLRLRPLPYDTVSNLPGTLRIPPAEKKDQTKKARL